MSTLIWLAIQWIAGALFIAAGGYVVVCNWSVLWIFALRRAHHSWVPLVGGCLLSAGLAVLPLAQTRQWRWIPLLADWGCLPGLALAAVWHLRRAGTKR